MMSGQKLERSHVVRQTAEFQLSQREDAKHLRIDVRRFKHLVCAWKRGGAACRGPG